MPKTAADLHCVAVCRRSHVEVQVAVAQVAIPDHLRADE